MLIVSVSLNKIDFKMQDQHEAFSLTNVQVEGQLKISSYFMPTVSLLKPEV